MLKNGYTILIKKSAGHFVALCLELNVAAQGDSLVEARTELQRAIELYKHFSDAKKVYTAPLDIETVREFLVGDSASDYRLNDEINFSEHFATTIPAHVHT